MSCNDCLSPNISRFVDVFDVFKAACSAVCSTLSKLQPLESWQTGARARKSSRRLVSGSEQINAVVRLPGASRRFQRRLMNSRDDKMSRGPARVQLGPAVTKAEVSGYCLTSNHLVSRYIHGRLLLSHPTVDFTGKLQTFKSGVNPT